MAGAEGAIQVIGDAGEVAGVLKQGKKGEENRHRRQHDRDDPAQRSPDALDQRAMEPGGGVEGGEEGGQPGLDPGKAGAQPRGGVVRAFDGEPEDKRQQGQHDGVTGGAAGEDPIESAVEEGVGLGGADGGLADGLGPGDEGGDQQVGQGLFVDAGGGQGVFGLGQSGGNGGLRVQAAVGQCVPAEQAQGQPAGAGGAIRAGGQGGGENVQRGLDGGRVADGGRGRALAVGENGVKGGG